jgi:hypothetical protein
MTTLTDEQRRTFSFTRSRRPSRPGLTCCVGHWAVESGSVSCPPRSFGRPGSWRRDLGPAGPPPTTRQQQADRSQGQAGVHDLYKTPVIVRSLLQGVPPQRGHGTGHAG